MNKNIERIMLGATILITLGLIVSCLWFLYEINILHWLVIFFIASWLLGTAIRKWGFVDDQP